MKPTTAYRKHRDGCPFHFAPLDTCDCVERNMLDEIVRLQKGNADLVSTAYDDGYDDSHRDMKAKLAATEAALEAAKTPVWKSWATTPPEPGMRVCVVADDGMSARLYLIVQADAEGNIGALDAEDGMDTLETYPPFFIGAIWCELPDDYTDFMFMAGE